MPRKRFLEAFGEATQAEPEGIHHLRLDDGETISFTYTLSAKLESFEIPLKLIATNVDGYPAGNSYILFTEDHHIDNRVLTFLESLQQKIDRQEVHTALRTISYELRDILTTGQSDNPIQLIDSSPRNSSRNTTRSTAVSHSVPVQIRIADDDDDEMDWDTAEIDSDNGFGFGDGEESTSAIKFDGTSNISGPSLSKIKKDLLAAKAAGFRVGVHGNPVTSGIVCISIRVTKLGISDEAMKAWALLHKQYLVLLIRFKHGYRDLDHFKDDKPSDDRVEMFVGLCDRYKPSLSSISEAFDQAEPSTDQTRPGALEQMFIGKPLNDLLRDRFASIVRFRSFGISWTGAERLFNETQGSMKRDLGQAISELKKIKDSARKTALPKIVMSDTLGTTPLADASLPLVAMQFVLRHFVRCTEFCLACHCLTNDSFEALKPYVCSKPLCLYQFLSYGFGPPVEHEILFQPHVVDLLVSLCYSQALAHRLKDIPLGLNLRVPLIPDYRTSGAFHMRHTPSTTSKKPEKPLPKIEPAFKAKWNRRERYLTIENDSTRTIVACKEGDWIVIIAQDEKIRHLRVKEISFLRIYISDCICTSTHLGDLATLIPDGEAQVDCYTYDWDFDALPEAYQQQAMLAMLRCIPSVSTLCQRLLDQRGKHREPALRNIKTIPHAARDILRWIVASNRSCIVQVDTVSSTATDMSEFIAVDTADSAKTDKNELIAAEPRVAGMSDWIQFRFAQGAPDKEQRFVESVKQYASNKEHPTIFAWHGSAIYNWHSIIRHGLNFDEILNGRASGHGVYMSSHLGTSMGYSQPVAQTSTASPSWPNSELQVNQVVSLQEVVNAVDSFVSRKPHFVVNQKEWIQTRYLFVRSTAKHSKMGAAAAAFAQDPRYAVRGSDDKELTIPITAIPKARRPVEKKQHNNTSVRKKKASKVDQTHDANIDECSDSESSDEEDTGWLQCDYVNDLPVSSIIFTSTRTCKRSRDRPKYSLDKAKTSFTPGALEMSNIRVLPPPADASPPATRSLLKVFKALIETQESIPLHEIGYYIDPDRVENMYQWIIELHSFDESLPLAQDMNKAGLTSIVIEMRFTNQFPFSPPFVRVVKPRFLPFLQGGGGHVTEGGAICMELLTSSGWSAVSSIESVILQVRLAMSERERPARLLTMGGRFSRDNHPGYDTSCYAISDAVQAFKRACSKHGWKVPDGVDGLTSQG